MTDWRFDVVVIETGDRPMIDLRVDIHATERLVELLDADDGGMQRGGRTDPRQDHELPPGILRRRPERGRE